MKTSARLGYIDWMRGLACLGMFQTHCYDAWLSPEARRSRFFVWSQVAGTFPAPAFLFLAGISVALVIQKMTGKGAAAGPAARKIILRGAEVLGLGLLLRIQEYLVSGGWAPWSDLFRVDILNTIGVAIILMGFLAWLTLWAGCSMGGLSIAAGATSALISLVTPLLWTAWRPRWMPWPLESYVNGVHNLHEPQPWLFPVFPWAGFAFAGLAVGAILWGAWARRREALVLLGAGAGGVALIGISRWVDWRFDRVNIYPVYDYWHTDYWHTSPSFFLLRVGMLLTILSLSYGWSRGVRIGFSPLRQLGQTSLLVYWVHIPLVYGKFSILPHNAESIRAASGGLLAIFLGMLLLSILRTRIRGRGAEIFSTEAKAAASNSD